ncbi:FRG domain-containing protein [Vibrio chagasii]|nr:FRG domain-containing protein [Vibrio chagasii]CAH7173757.1 FRG domain-containing protein [Vibrio chagasii]CAH7254270.1 FRG domain-containing protein [Vibrio chagasii]
MLPSFPHRKWYEQRINTMDELEQYVLNAQFPEEAYFRGMPNSDFICISSFYRQYLLNNKDSLKWQYQQVGHGVTMSLPKIDKSKYKEHSFEILDYFYTCLRELGSKELSFNSITYLAQHYGLPTNLIDFSANPKVSLFFACHDEDEKFSDKDCTLYMSDILWHVKSMMPSNQTMKMGHFKHPTENRLLTDAEADDLMFNMFTTIDKEQSVTVTPKIELEEVKYSARIRNQEGVFVYHCDHVPFDRIMHTSKCNDGINKVFVINKELKPKILDELNSKYKINKKYVYPDVDEDPNAEIIETAVKKTKEKFDLPV